MKRRWVWVCGGLVLAAALLFRSEAPPSRGERRPDSAAPVGAGGPPPTPTAPISPPRAGNAGTASTSSATPGVPARTLSAEKEAEIRAHREKVKAESEARRKKKAAERDAVRAQHDAAFGPPRPPSAVDRSFGPTPVLPPPIKEEKDAPEKP